MHKQRHGPSDAHLAAQLEGYATSLRANGNHWKDRLATWPAFAAATGSALALATAAGADIIYSGIQNLSISISNQHTVTGPFGRISQKTAPIKMNLAGPTNIKLFLQHVQFSHTNVVTAGLLGNGAATSFGGHTAGTGKMLTNNGLVKHLASGARISAGAGVFASAPFQKALHFAGSSSFSGHHSFQGGSFPKSTRRGFAGVSFGQAGARHFGWIRLEWQDTNGVTNGAGDPIPNTLTAIDWAYESAPGVGILAGATPEPSTLALALMATGSTGLLAWRKWRKAEGANGQAEG
jgi:hypothetical protein